MKVLKKLVVAMFIATFLMNYAIIATAGQTLCTQVFITIKEAPEDLETQEKGTTSQDKESDWDKLPEMELDTEEKSSMENIPEFLIETVKLDQIDTTQYTICEKL